MKPASVTALSSCTARGLVNLVAPVLLVCGCAKAPEPPPPVRPLKTIQVQRAAASKVRVYPGKVLAGERVQLAFDVPGSLIELNVREGDTVVEGQVLARLDPSDFDNAVKAARAELERAEAQYRRVEEAAKLHAVSQQELSNARAAVDTAKAELDIRVKAREDSVLKAKFDGVIAARMVDNFTAVQAKQPIVSLQRITDVEIEIYVPETHVLGIDPDEVNSRKIRSKITATFESRPDAVYDLALKEFSTEADRTTQTFRVVLTMPAPADLLVLPGMTVSVRVEPPADDTGSAEVFELPLDCVPVDGTTGKHFVWLVVDDGKGAATVQKRFVEVGETRGDNVMITAGLETGDRIAAAGVTLLREGQTVKPFEASAR